MSFEEGARQILADPLDFSLAQNYWREVTSRGETEAFEKWISKQQKSGKSRSLILAGHLARLKGKPAEALGHYQRAADRAKDKGQSLAVFGVYLAEIGKGREALTVLERAIKASSSKDVRLARFRRAVDLAIRLREKPRIEALFRILDSAGKSKALQMDRASALAAAGYDADAREIWRKVLKKTKPSQDHHQIAVRELGKNLERFGDLEGALQLYTRFLKRLPRSHWIRPEIFERILDLHRQTGDLEALLKNLKRYVSGLDQLRAKARILEELARTDEAIKIYEKMLRRYRYAPEPYERLARLYRLQGRLNDIAKLLKKQMRSMPGEVRVRFELARVLGELGRSKSATRLLEETSSRFARDPSVQSEVVDLLVRLKAPSSMVLRQFERLRRLEPREPEHLESLGAYLYGQHKLDESQATWAKLLKLVKPRSQAHLRLARILRDHHFDKDAALHFGKAVELSPDDPEVLAAVAEWKEHLRLPNEAIVLWDKILAVDPEQKHEETHKAVDRLLELLSEVGQLRGRVEGYAGHVGSKDLGLGESILGLRGLARLGHVTDALEAGLKDASLRNYPTPILYALLGVARRGGDHEQILKFIQLIKENDARADVTLDVERAELLIRLSREVEAREVLAGVLARAPGDTDTLRRIADLFERLGAIGDAADTLRRALESYPEKTALAFRLASLYRRIGRESEERTILEHVIKVSRKPIDVQRAGRRLIALARTPTHLDSLDRVLGAIMMGVGDPTAAYNLWIDVQVRRARLVRSLDTLGLAQESNRKPPLGRLMEALGGTDGGAKAKALEILALTPAPGTEQVIASVLDDPDPAIQFAAIAVLAECRSQAAFNVLYRKVLSVRQRTRMDERIVLAAIWALGVLPASVEIPWGRLYEERARHDQRLGLVLAAGIRKDIGAIDLIRSELASRSDIIRAAATFALAQLGAEAPDSLVRANFESIASDHGVVLLARRALARKFTGDAARDAITRALLSGRLELLGDLLYLAHTESAGAREEDDLQPLWQGIFQPAAARLEFRSFLPAALARQVTTTELTEINIDLINATIQRVLQEAGQDKTPKKSSRLIEQLVQVRGALDERLSSADQRSLCRGLETAIAGTGLDSGVIPAHLKVALLGDCTGPVEIESLENVRRELLVLIFERLTASSHPIHPTTRKALRPRMEEPGLRVQWLELATRHSLELDPTILNRWLDPGAKAQAVATLQYLASTSDRPLDSSLLTSLERLARSRDLQIRASLVRLLCRRPFKEAETSADLKDLQKDTRRALQLERQTCSAQ
ncbi:MAG: hypothetical protein CMH54_00195 [Myxococcales bacterium]|nr:hypothetical protein [Myxococcales bacterium]